MDLQTGKEVAVKVEKVNSPSPQLYYEARLYRLLQGGVGIPQVHFFVQEAEDNIMVEHPPPLPQAYPNLSALSLGSR